MMLYEVNNPYFEVSTVSANGEWIRLQGKATFYFFSDEPKTVTL